MERKRKRGNDENKKEEFVCFLPFESRLVKSDYLLALSLTLSVLRCH